MTQGTAKNKDSSPTWIPRRRQRTRHVWAAALFLVSLSTAMTTVVVGLLAEVPVLRAVATALAAAILSVAGWMVWKQERARAEAEARRRRRRRRRPQAAAAAAKGSPPLTADERWQRGFAKLRPAFQAANSPELNWLPGLAPSGIDADKPKVTVVVPAHNRAGLLVQTLSSLQRQDFPDWECVVVNDASTDHVLDVARMFCDRDPRFRIASHDAVRGLAASRNTGLMLARADFVTFLDGDDILFRSALSRRLEEWSDPADEALAGVYCDWRPFYGLDVPAVPSGVARALNRITALSAPWDCPFIASAPLLRTDVVSRLGGFDESLSTAEDADLWVRVLRAGYYFNYARYVGIGYRQVANTMLRKTVVAHADHMVSLSRSLEEPIDDPAIVSGPLPLHRPLSHYVRHHSLADRLVRHLVMALADGDRPGAERVAADIDPAVVALNPDPAFITHATDAALRRLGMHTPRFAGDAARIRSDTDAILNQRIESLPAAHFPEDSQAGSRAKRAASDLRSRPLAEGDHQLRVLPHRLRMIDDWYGEAGADGAVLLLPQARYHVDELGPLAEELQAQGAQVVFMAPVAEGVIGKALLAQVISDVMKYTDQMVEWDPTFPLKARLAAVVVMNDWGPGRQLVLNAKSRAIPTFAKIEGVQDFGDRDTGWERRPYRTVDIVLGQGRNDQDALPDAPMHIVGNHRLEAAWRGADSFRERIVAINLNFTYNVQTEHANRWLKSVVSACVESDVDYVLCPHPAQLEELFDSELLLGKVSTEPIRHVLLRAGLLVTRFSTVVYEAMARGVPTIYHNPHGEKVWSRIARTSDALPVTNTTSELAHVIQQRLDPSRDFRIAAQNFFSEQISLHEGASAASRTAEAVLHGCARRAADGTRPV